MVSTAELTPSEAGPSRVGPWRLEGLLGAGGFGSVYRARDGSGRTAVVKVLRRPPGDELRALCRVHHPGVVTALGGGVGVVPYLAMALAPGVPLSTLGPVPASEVLVYVARLADALAACHRAGVVHGDLKPANVLVEADTQRVTLVDFGLVGGAGGTPAWAAPEVLSGASTSAASDVYGLGLIAWELLSGGPPWPELSAEARLLTRAHTALPPVRAPRPLADLIPRMVAIDPKLRPTAEAVADALEAFGVPVATPSRAEVARRTTAARVARPFDRALVRWLSEGGAIALVGPRGSGRSHALAGVANELQARGVCAVRIAPATEPWGPIEAALQDEALPGAPAELPRAADPETRADAAAEALIARSERGLSVLVDDWDALDAGTRDTVAALERQGVAILIAAAELPPFARAVPVPPFDADAVRELLDAMLGAADPALVEWIGRGTPLPGPVVRGVLDAIDAGALAWRHRAWVVDPDRLGQLEPPHDAPPAPASLSGDALRLAVVIARAQPVGRTEALELAGVSAASLDELVDLGWVRDASPLTVGGAVVAAALAACADRVEIDRSLCRVWTARAPVPWLRLGPALVGAGDPELAGRFGGPALRAWLELDVAKACALADGFGWVSDPTPELQSARIEVLVRAGRAEDARALGATWLARAPDGPASVPVLLQLAKVEDGAEDVSAMAGWIDRARAALGDVPASPEVLLAIARGLFRAHRLTEAREVCLPLVAAPPDAAGLAVYLQAHALVAQIVGDIEGPEAGLATLVDLAEEVGRGTPERAVVEMARGRLQYHAGRPRDAAATFEAAAAVRRALPLLERARLENNAALCWYGAGDVDRAVAGWERALLGFERVGAAVELVRVRVNLCQGYRDLGRWARAEDAGQRAVTAASELGIRAFEAVALGNLGDCALWQRRFAQAEHWFDQAEKAARAENLTSELVELARRRAELASARRDANAVARIEAAIGVAEASGAPIEVARCRALLAWARAHEGKLAEFRRLGDQALESLRALGATGDLAVVRLALAEGWTVLGREREAAAEAEHVTRYAEEFGRPPLAAWAERILLRVTRGRDDRDRLELLTRLAVRVAIHTELDVMLQELAAALVEAIDAERALVLLLDGGEPRVVASAGDELQRPPSMSIVKRVVALGRELVVTDLEERADLRSAESVVSMHLRAVYCVPLLVDGVVLGALYLDSREQPVGALREATALVRALAAHASIALRNARQTSEIRSHNEMIRDLAHDLGNPLSGIGLLASDVVAGGAPIGKADAQMIVDATNTALTLVQRTLGARTDGPSTFPLSDGVRTWVGPLRAHARRQGVDLVVEADARGTVRAQPGELQRVLQNLVSNALKYTPRGGVVTVRTLDEVDRVGLEVTDTGRGLPPESLPRIFDRGYQAPGSLPGHGLGLSIVKRLVEQHGGAVRAVNRPEGGAAFTVWLPRLSERVEPSV